MITTTKETFAWLAVILQNGIWKIDHIKPLITLSIMTLRQLKVAYFDHLLEE
jgi:hypothetical protein